MKRTDTIPSKRFPGVLLSLVIVTAVAAISGCEDSGRIFARSSPAPLDPGPLSVMATAPVDGSVGVPVNSVISVTFGTSIDPATLASSTFTLTDEGNNPVVGTVMAYGATATFSPSSHLQTNTRYTATVTTGIAGWSGNHLAHDESWSFTTSSSSDVTPPSVSSTAPGYYGSDVAVNTPIRVTFTEPVDPVTIDASTFTVKELGGNAVTGTFACEGTSAVFTPSSSLLANTTYEAAVTTGVRDLAGNHLAYSYSWVFTTGSGVLHYLFEPYVSIPTGSWPEAVAIGDVNGDGRNDVVLVTSFYFDDANDYRLFVFLQDDAGKLGAPAKYLTSGSYTSRPSSVAVGDLNHDGKADVVVGNSGKNIDVYLQDGAGRLEAPASYDTVNSNKIRVADLNDDGLLDVVGIGWGTGTADVLLQNARGTLDVPVRYAVSHGGYDDLDVADVDGDGLSDVIVMSGQSYAYPNIGVLTQTRHGTLSAPVYYSVGGDTLTSGVAAGDVNADGLNDVVVTYGGNSPSSRIGIFLQNGGGALDAPVGYSSYDCPGPVEIADVDHDGRNDIVVAHGGWLALGVYLQAPDGTIMPEERYSLPYASHYGPHALAVGDIDGDGLNDVVIADYNHGLVILRHR
jgi:hypothetical protein